MLHSSVFFDNFGYFISKHPNVKLDDLFSKGQMFSKKWVIEELLKLNINLGTVFICAGWYGTLATFLFESNLKLEKIRSFDIDQDCEKIADSFNRCYVIDNWKFKASTLDISEMKYPLEFKTTKSNGEVITLFENPDTIINTSCEHIEKFDNWYSSIPHGKLVILQTNNGFDIPGHVNCVSSLEEFERQTPMTKVIYSGEREMPKFTRYMRIGIY